MLSIKNLTKVYKIKGGNDTLALDKVNIDFPEKGMVFLLGKSGSGKSTLLNLIGGLDFPSDGEIILKGRSSKDFSQSDFDSYRNTYIGFIFQEYNILSEIEKKIKTSYILFIIYGIVNIYFPENRLVLKKICIFILSFLAFDFELKKYKNKY